MKKFYALLATALLTGSAATQAQMVAYDVETTTAEYTDLAGATVVDLQGTTGNDFSGIMLDADGNLNFNAAEDVTAFPIGFDFGYNGQTMKYFLIGTDGEILLSPTQTVTTDLHKNFNTMFSNSAFHDAFGIVMREGNYAYDDSEISYKTEGEAGSRVLTIQYKNIDARGTWNADADNCGARINIQYRLYEANGNIAMQVKGFQPVSTGGYNFMRIGLIGDGADILQVQSYDGATVGTHDTSISYSTESYPADGTTYTFVAPEVCQTPTAAPAALMLTSTTTQVSGIFAKGNGDHCLVLISKDGELTETPTDRTKYSVGQQLGNATVLAIAESNRFQTPESIELEAATSYTVFVYAFNSLCMNGPLYNATPAKATVVTKPAAPAAISVVGTTKNSVTLSVTATADAPVLIAMSDRMELNDIGQALDHGTFGTPGGDYAVGDVLYYYYDTEDSEEPVEGENPIVYIGGTNKVIEVTGLQPGKDYYFRAWSSDGNGAFSSTYVEVSTITVAELPWAFVPDMAGAFTPVGWTIDQEYTWTNNQYAEPPYFGSQISFTDAETLKETWMESPAIELGEGTNTLSVDVAASMFTFRTFAAPAYTMQDGEKLALQLTTDGQQYVDILAFDKDNMPAVEANPDEEIEAGNYFLSGVFTHYDVDFSQLAGQTVKLRIYVKRYTNGAFNLANLALSNKVTTAIDEVGTDRQRAAQSIYTLAGQRLSAPQKGLNIINGKKVMVR